MMIFLVVCLSFLFLSIGIKKNCLEMVFLFSYSKKRVSIDVFLVVFFMSSCEVCAVRKEQVRNSEASNLYIMWFIFATSKFSYF